MFVHRISDSSTYVILFPTGLLFMVSTNPLAVHSKMQLNLKRDESILEYSYSISSNFKNQCIWLLDEKQQVWKCQNELNPNSGNWSVQKITMFDTNISKKFLDPAMKFDDYHMTTSLNKLKCFQEIGLDDSRPMEFLFAYNGTSTRSIIVKQPLIKKELEQSPNTNEMGQLQSIFKSHIKIFVVYKK